MKTTLRATLGLLALFSVLVEVCRCEDAYPITPTSIIKLANVSTQWVLNSHIYTYGSGSQGQSVTLASDADSDGTNFVVMTEDVSRLGHGIRCGDLVYLIHSATGKYLTIDKAFKSPFETGLEVSMTDIDRARKVPKRVLFEVQCRYDKNEAAREPAGAKAWMSDANVALYHADTQTYLGVSGKVYGQPISGQREVMGDAGLSSTTLWRVWGGFLMEEALE